MIARIGSRSFLFALGVAASLSAQGTPALSMLPNPAPADTSFRLYLQGFSLSCLNCIYSTARESVTVKGNRIDLRAVIPTTMVMSVTGVQASPLAIISGQLPDFPMPPLRPGRYEVWVAMVPECLDQKACTIPERPPVSVGPLDVKAGVSATYILNPGSAPAAKPFDMQLLSGGYSCATAFDSLSTEVSGDVITVTFYDWERPMGCAIAYEMFGPTFKLPALPAGTYRVKVERLSKQSVFEAGILEIVGTTALGEGARQNGPIPANASRAGLAAPGSALQIIWRGHSFDFSGRRAHQASDLGSLPPSSD